MMMLIPNNNHVLVVSSLVLLVVFLAGANAFQAPFSTATPTQLQQQQQRHPRADTRLYIISGALKKYRAEQEKKKMPLATREETKQESPGLRVASSVWKWPSIWPYDKEFFMPPEDIPKPPAVNMNQMASMMSGIAQPTVPTTTAAEEQQLQETKLDVRNYWGVEKANVKTEMDPEAIEKLKQ
jgi:hypothetical protein